MDHLRRKLVPCLYACLTPQSYSRFDSSTPPPKRPQELHVHTVNRKMTHASGLRQRSAAPAPGALSNMTHPGTLVWRFAPVLLHLDSIRDEHRSESRYVPSIKPIAGSSGRGSVSQWRRQSRRPLLDMSRTGWIHPLFGLQARLARTHKLWHGCPCVRSQAVPACTQCSMATNVSAEKHQTKHQKRKRSTA